VAAIVGPVNLVEIDLGVEGRVHPRGAEPRPHLLRDRSGSLSSRLGDIPLVFHVNVLEAQPVDLRTYVLKAE
jgi:hypothetical protein